MKDNEIKNIVNELRDLAITFGQTQQLRERIHRCIVPVLKKMHEVEQENIQLRSLMQGWSCYGWKDNEYIDDVQSFFTEKLAKK
jgi:hypothetical protein